MKKVRNVYQYHNDVLMCGCNCIPQKCSSHQYLNRERFMTDLNQIVENSITYNGPSSPYTQTAQHMKAEGIHELQKVNGTLCPTIHYYCSQLLQDADLLGKLEKRVSGAASPSPLLKLLEGSQQLADDLLLEDLQHSSSSSSSGSDSEDMENLQPGSYIAAWRFTAAYTINQLLLDCHSTNPFCVPATEQCCRHVIHLPILQLFRSLVWYQAKRAWIQGQIST